MLQVGHVKKQWENRCATKGEETQTAEVQSHLLSGNAAFHVDQPQNSTFSS